MKIIITSLAVIFSAACFAQSKMGNPQPVPVQMSAPVRVQNSQQNSSAPKQNADPKKTETGKAKESSPAVDNKIAVSDPGTPGDKSAAKKGTQPTESKKANSGVSPK